MNQKSQLAGGWDWYCTCRWKYYGNIGIAVVESGYSRRVWCPARTSRGVSSEAYPKGTLVMRGLLVEIRVRPSLRNFSHARTSSGDSTKASPKGAFNRVRTSRAVSLVVPLLMELLFGCELREESLVRPFLRELCPCANF